jgi:hypothetical protein
LIVLLILLGAKSHIHIPLLRLSIHRILPSQRLNINFCNNLNFLQWEVNPMPNPQVGGPPFVSCLWLVTQCIYSYPL